jgi:hypothetical protein
MLMTEKAPPVVAPTCTDTVEAISERFNLALANLRALNSPEVETDPNGVPVDQLCWNAKNSVHYLQSKTGKPWTVDRLLKVAIALGWRKNVEGKPPEDHNYFTEAAVHYGKDKMYPFAGYTYLALSHIIENVDECWSLSSSKKG